MNFSASRVLPVFPIARSFSQPLLPSKHRSRSLRCSRRKRPSLKRMIRENDQKKTPDWRDSALSPSRVGLCTPVNRRIKNAVRGWGGGGGVASPNTDP